MGFVVRLARTVYALRAVLWGLTVLAAGAFVALLVFPREGGDYLLGAVCAILLGLSLNGLGYAFRDPIPEVDPGAPLLRRAGLRIARAGRWFLALLMLGLLGLSLLFTLRAIGMMG